MYCYNCGRRLSERDFCTACRADVALYKKVVFVSNMYYNEGLEKACVRDLSGAVISLRQSLKFYKNNIDARNLLGLVFFEMGEVADALREWVISKNMRPEKNIADEYIDKIRSSASRLDSINQTVKKYNRALEQCAHDGRDLAAIQLRKVLSMNPRFLQARQLLALLYMERGEWERAERELRKCMETDRNNLQTLRCLKEVEQALMPEEGSKALSRRRREEAVRYQSENELIIQPLNVKEPKSGGGISAVLNLAIGLAIGLAAMYFLVVPAAQSKVRDEEQQTIAKISGELDAKTVRIQELEGQITSLEAGAEALRSEIEGYVGPEGAMETAESLMQISAAYTETEDMHAAMAQLEALAERVDVAGMPEGFQKLYQALAQTIGPALSEEYYKEGYQQYYTDRYTEAAETLAKAVKYDAANADALYLLGEAYRSGGDTEKAIATYDEVMKLFPDTQRAKDAKRRKNSLDG